MSLLPWDKVLAGVNSPLDWAIVLGAGTVGFTLDAAVNIVPIPIFSPGVCGVTAMTTALTVKKAADAAQSARRQRKLAELAIVRASHLVRQLEEQGDTQMANGLTYLVRRVEVDPTSILALEEALSKVTIKPRRR